MTRHIRWAAAFVLLLVAWSAQAAETRLVSIKTPRGVNEAFILIEPAKPVASVILFAGGHGALGLKSASSMKWGAGNFLVRTRDMFAAHGFMVAVVDAPSDRKKGMNAVFRMSGSHAGDIGAVAAYLKKRAPVPIWLIGTSMGTFSAADGAIAGHADGLVLTSTITHSPARWNIAESMPHAVANMALSRVSVPTLILAHRHDGCHASPPSGAAMLKQRLSKAKKVEVVMLDGGLPPRSEPCEAKAQHGYYGIEDKAVDAIAGFIKANSK
jgi:pimeloyl-ACP methyl ester carboxylesterase